MTESLIEVRVLVRSFVRSPGFPVVALLTLALGIGATTAIFSVVNGVLLRPLPYRDPERLVAVFTHNVQRGETRNAASPADFEAWRDANEVFDHLTAVRSWTPSLTGRERPEQVLALKASTSLFTLLGVEPFLGRVFVPEDTDEHVVVIGYSLWKRRFGAEKGVLGERIVLDGEPYTVIGVMPRGFEFPPFWFSGAELWAPRDLAGEKKLPRHASFLRVFARLKVGIGLEEAQSELDAVARHEAEQSPQSNAGIGVKVEPLLEPAVEDVRPALQALLAAVALVLLVACANLSSLALARGEARHREMAIRRALGATQKRLALQLLSESVLLGLGGGALGLLLAQWLLGILPSLAPPDMPRLDQLRLDLRVLAFATSVSLFAGVVFGLAPALRASRACDASELRGGSYSRLYRAFLFGEVALALTLLAGAGLLVRSFHRLTRVDLGFRVDDVLTLGVSFEGTRHAASPEQKVFLQELVDGVKLLLGVEGAAVVSYLPIGDDEWRTPFVILGRPEPAPSDVPLAVFKMASADYFKVMGIPLIEGRGFDPQDRADVAPVLIVNEALARRFWPGESPVGAGLQMAGRTWTVVGVVGNTRQWSLNRAVRSEMYLPYSQQASPFGFTRLVVRTRLPAASMIPTVEARIWQIDPTLPVTDVRTMGQILSRDLAPQRFNTFLLALFALVALTLAAVGVYGVVTQAVGRRFREIAVRIAVGASSQDVLRLVARAGYVPVAYGLATGLLLALGLTRYLSALLFETRPAEPLTLLAVTLLLSIVAIGACYVAARKATRVDPIVVLRHE